MNAGAVTGWPFAGRDRELAVVQQNLTAGTGVLLHGAAGVGKTRLARETERWWCSTGGEVVAVSGSTASRDVPLSALSHLIPPAPERPPTQGGEPPTELLARVIQAIRARHDRGARLLLSVDDAPRLDEPSAAVIGQVARQRLAVVLCTARVGDPTPEAISALWRDDLVERVELDPLDEPSVRRLLRVVLGGPVEQATTRRLWDLTRGNLLFLREVVGEGQRRGRLRMVEGLWCWNGAVGAPRSLTELIGGRLGQLSERHRHTLEVVALVEPIPLSVLTKVANSTVLDEVEAAGLIEAQRRGEQLWVSTAHPLFGEVVRDGVNTGRAATVRLAVAAALETVDESPDATLRAVLLRLEAGELPRQRQCLDAAWAAWSRGDADLTRRLADAALQHGRAPEAIYVLGEAHAAEGDFDAAERTWATLGDLTEPEYLVARVAQSRVPLLALALGRPDDAAEVYERAMAHLTDVELRGLLTATRNVVLPAMDPPNAADVLVVPEGVNDEAITWTWISAAQVALNAGRADLVLEGWEAMRPVVQRARSTWPLAALFVDVHRFLALIDVGDVVPAREMAAAELEAALDNPEILARCMWTQAVGHASLFCGRLQEACEYLDDAVALLRRHDPGTLAFALVALAMARSLRGEADRAEAALEEVDSLPRPPFTQPITTTRARALVDAAAGRNQSAVDALRTHWEHARRSGSVHAEMDLLAGLVQLGAVLPEHCDRIEELAHHCGLASMRRLSAAARGIVSDDGSALAAAATAAEQAGAILDAADWWARVATAAHHHGLTSTSLQARRAAGALVERYGPFHSPALREFATPSRLTDREREVATLAAKGHTNAEISQRLDVSIRTVHAHLRSVFTKLGLHRREDLAEAIG